MIVSFYNGDGRFVQTVEGDMNLVIAPSAAASGMNWIEGAYGSEHYAVAGQAQPRPACPATLDGQTLLNVPAASVIKINRQSYDCEDGGTVELEFDQPGTYAILVTCWPYLDGEFEYENPTP